MFIENIVLGSSLRALEFAERHHINVIYKVLSYPMEFENNYVHWRHKFIKNCLEGNIMFHDRVSNILIDEDRQVLHIKTNSFADYNIEYEKLFVFASEDIMLSSTYPNSVETTNLVYDWYELTSVDSLKDLTSVLEIPRIEEAWMHENKLVTKMILGNQELHDISFSDTYYKFLIQNALIDSGHRGRKNGFTALGAQKHLSLELSSVKREVKPKTVTKYTAISNLEFFDD